MQSWPGISLRALFLLLVVVATTVLTGCASTESENLSERPWNSPQGWENGMGGMMGPGGFYGR